MKPGAVLDGRYELVRLLGKGARGAVWQGNDLKIQRPVAVKTVLDRTDRRLIDRMGHEATTAGRLSHPHIVTVHDYGQTEYDETPVTYIVMELVDGRPLTAVLAEGRPELAVALGWARQIALALGAAHAPGVGVVHRDLKPDNVLITRDGLVKLVDFGIARFIDDAHGDTRLTRPGTLNGTPAYMAPEQCLSQPVDGRTDLYALGCLLYEMVTGHPPFSEGSPLTVALSQVHDVPAPARSRNDTLSPELDLLIRDLLAKSPALRPPDAEAAYRRLGVVAAAQQDESADEPRPVPVRRPPAPRPPVRDLVYAELLHRFGGPDALTIEDDSAAAVLLWEDAVAELTAEAGPTHPRTLTARRGLAWHTGACGDHAQAIAMWRALIPDAQYVQGHFHEAPYTAQRLLAWNIGVTGRPAEAVRQLTELLPDATRLLGRRHLDVLEARRFLAWNTGAMGRHARAVRLLRRLLPDLAIVVGPDHEHTLEARRLLAWSTGQSGDLVKAVGLLRDLVPDTTRALGTNHPQTAEALRLLDRYSQ
jgi:hypothetical protein